VAVLAALFFLSGFSALVYQIVWLRLLALVFGVTVYAASAVLTSFMSGLALGSWLGGRFASRLGHPLRAFALVEIGIAASALLVPVALDAAGAIYAFIHNRQPDALWTLTLARVICSGLVLLVPTTLMGASLPLLSQHVATSGAVASRIGVLYATNTAGGIVGTLLAGYILIGDFGVTATTRIAAVSNLVVGASALLLAAAAKRAMSSPPETSRISLPSQPGPVVVLVVLALGGFTALALEVVWFRILVLFLPATTYAFTTMLATVLLGIALGSAVAAARVRRSRNAARALAWIQIWAGVLTLWSMAALAYTYSIGWRTSGVIQACVVAMLPATAMMGAAFPFGLALWLGEGAHAVGRRVGVLYAVNVCGAVLGALAGGFLLLPLAGTRLSLLLLAAVYVLAGCIVPAVLAGRTTVLRIAAVALVLFAAAALMLPDIYASVLARRYGRNERVVFRAEGVQTTATVHHKAPGETILYLDGLHQANDTQAMVRVHAEIGHLPMVLHPDPQRSLVIGLGGGVTAGAVSSHRDTAVDVVELADSVRAAAAYFSHVNGDVLQQPNVRLRIDDGRNYLLLTPNRYDVLTADIIQPIHAGAGNLYSTEYFRLARGVLAGPGLMLQWIGHREETHYKLIMRTFLNVFPHATLWSNGSLMVGSLEPLALSRRAIGRRLASAGAREGLMLVGLDSVDAVLARYTAGPDEMRRFVGEGLLLTDDRPLLEYHRSLSGRDRPVDVSSLRGDVMRHVVD
jgi:spermidine synthase